MSTTHSRTALNPRRGLCTLLFTLAIAPLASSDALAQIPSSRDRTAAPPVMEAALALPDSPGSVSSSTPAGLDLVPAAPGLSAAGRYDGRFQTILGSTNGVVAGHLTKYIEPGQQAPTLRIGDKILLGIKDSASPLSAAGWLLSAGYSQAVNGSPNYGTNGKAFVQRLGASAARNVSEGIFSDSVMASVLHEDPRYYKMGKGHNVFKRALYAGTRPIITRTDGGRQTINFAYISGNLAGAALTQAYYPPVNRGATQVMQTWGGSIGGGAVGFLASEFLSDILQSVHLQHPK